MSVVFCSIIVVAIINGISPLITKMLMSNDSKFLTWNKILMLSIILVFMTSIKYIVTKLQSLIGHKYGYIVEQAIRNHVFEKILNLDLDEINKRKKGEVGSLITNDATQLAEFSYHFFQTLLETILGIVIGVVVMAQISMQLTLIIVVYLIISQTISFFLSRQRKQIFKQINHEMGIINGICNEQLDNILIIQTLNQQNFENAKFASQNSKLYKLYLRGYKLLANFIAFNRFSTNALNLVIIGYGSYLAMHHNLNLGVLVSFLMFANLLSDPIRAFISIYEMYINSMSNLNRLFDFTQIKSQIEKNEKTNFCNGDIKFQNLSFTYANNKVLNDFSLTIKKNQKVGIIGKSGSGKTTLINLLQRKLVHPSKTITIGGNYIEDITLASYKQNISIVSQNTPILNDTIENNIKYGIENCDENTYKEAILFANLNEFINDFSALDQSILTEDGSNISGGQKQRIAIARAIIKKSPIIIFDEATSALDNESEKIIMDNLKKLPYKVTIIMIAHRLTTVSDCDQIVYIDKGKIKAIGTHQQLLDSDKTYKEMYLMYEEEQNV